MAADKTVTVKFTSDTKGYVDGVEEATIAQEKLEKAIEDTDKASESSPITTGAAKESLNDLSGALTQTTEGLIDSTTGMSGLGAAFTSIAGRIRTAATAMSTFSKAMIATGIGAAIAGIIALIVYWKEITQWLGFANEELEEHIELNEELDEQSSILEKRVELLILQGRTEAEINRLRAQLLNEEVSNARIALGIVQQRVNAQKDLAEDLQAEFRLQGELLETYTQAQLAVDILEQKIANLNNTLTEQERITRDLIASINQDIIDAQTEFDSQAFANADQAVQDYLDNRFESTEIVLDEIEEMEEEHLDAQTEREIEAQRRRVAQRAQDQADALTAQEQIDAARMSSMNSVFNLAQTLAGEQQQLAGALMIGQAVAQGAGAIVGVLNDPTILYPAKPAVIAAVVATTAAQIATIAQAMNTSGAGSGAGASLAEVNTNREAVETAVSDTSITSPQIVLVTEHLDAVQNQVTVTADRSSI